MVAVASLEKETIELKEKVAEANTKIKDALKSVDEVHQEFATQCATYLETIEKQADELKVKISSTEEECLMRLEKGRKEES